MLCFSPHSTTVTERYWYMSSHRCQHSMLHHYMLCFHVLTTMITLENLTRYDKANVNVIVATHFLSIHVSIRSTIYLYLRNGYLI